MKYPALDPRMNLKSRHEVLDYDYLHKLSPDELAFLNKFTEEYTNANLNTEKPRRNLHKTAKMRKDCYDRNNSRNRDVLTRQRASNKYQYLDEIVGNGYSEQERLDAKMELQRMDILDSEGNVKRKKRTFT